MLALRVIKPIVATETLPLLLFDGICGLCHKSVQFILKHDRNAVFRFAALQSSVSQDILKRHSHSPKDLSSVVLVLNHDTPREMLLFQSDAVLRILSFLGTPWSLCLIFGIFPKKLRDSLYNWIAANRYKWFGKDDTCFFPDKNWQSRFLDNDKYFERKIP